MGKNLKLMDCVPYEQWLDENRIKLWWEDCYYNMRKLILDIPSFYNNCVYGIKNIIYFLPVIWRYRHWDFEYILDILLKTLEIHKKRLLKNGIAIDTNKTAEEIELSIQDIKKYLEYSEDFEKENQELLSRIKNSKNDDALKEYLSQLLEFENEKWDNIFENLKKNMRKWWD